MRLSYALFAAVILFLAATQQLDPVWVLIVSALCGLVRPTDIGLRSALVGATVPPAHLTAAMGISRTTMDSAKVGGALAGTGFMAVFGMTTAYCVITGLHIAGALLTLMTDDTPGTRRADSHSDPAQVAPSPWRDLKAGMAYIWQTPRLLAATVSGLLLDPRPRDRH
jgi:hypothetical protein